METMGLPLVPSGPLGVWGPLLWNHTDAQNEFEDENYCQGEETVSVEEYLKAKKKNPNWVCQGKSESDVFKMRAITQVNSQSGGGRHTGGMSWNDSPTQLGVPCWTTQLCEIWEITPEHPREERTWFLGGHLW